MVKTINMAGVKIGGKQKLVLIAGPCVIESRKACLDMAARLVDFAGKNDVSLVFKASYDKANRTSHRSYRGPGIAAGLEILAEVKERFAVPVLTDIHSESEVVMASKVIDVIQVPAFLCRQTDLLVAAAESGCIVNVKKGQFLSPWDMGNVVAKLESGGCRKIILTERGASFGYNNLVADMRSLLVMREYGYPVVFDATHSVQRPGGAGTSSGGDSVFAPALARAAVAVGCDGIFMETNVDPSKALSDGANAIAFKDLKKHWKVIREISETVRQIVK